MALLLGSASLSAQTLDATALEAMKQQLEAQLGTLGSELAGAKEALSKAQAEAAAKIEAITKQLTDGQAQLTQANSKLSAAETQLTAAQGQLTQIKTQLEDAQYEIAAQKSQIAERDGRFKAAVSEIQDRDARIEDLTFQIDAQKTAREGSSKSLTDTQAKLTAAATSVETLEKQVADLTKARDAALADAKAKAATLDQTLSTAAGARSKLMEDLRAARAAAEQSQVQLASLAQSGAAAEQRRATLPAGLVSALAGKPDVQRVGDRAIIPADLLYSFGRTKLSTEGEGLAKDIAGAIGAATANLPADSNWAVLLTAHSDSTRLKRGSAYASNLEVSLERARNLVDALVAAGVPERRLIVAGVGSSQPLVQEQDSADRARNRRVELELVLR